MKKIFYLSLASILLLSACSKEAMVENNEGVGQTVLYAGFAENEEVKASVDSRLAIGKIEGESGNQKSMVKWSPNDKIVAFAADGSEKIEYTIQETKPVDNGTFQAEKVPTKVMKHAFYPETFYDPDIDSYTTFLPITYDAKKNLNNAPMWGTINGSNITFSHSCAMLKLDLGAVVTSAYKVTIKSTAVLSGRFIYNKEHVLGADPGNNNKQIVINRPAEKKQIYVPLPQGEYGLTIKLDKPNISFTLPSRKLVCGKMYVYTPKAE